MIVAARNLSVIMRAIIGIGGPRSLQGLRKILQIALTHFDRLLSALDRLFAALGAPMTQTSRAIGGRRSGEQKLRKPIGPLPARMR